MKLETIPVEKDVDVELQPATDRELMELARFLISKGWNQKSGATTEDGRFCGTNSPEAHNYCVIGAMYRAVHDTSFGMSDRRQSGLSHHLGRIFQRANKMNPEISHIANWNDDKNRTKEQVLAAMDKAVAAC